MCRSSHGAHGTFDEVSLGLLSSLILFAIGSLCIALVALYHQDEAVLIVIACSTILHGLTSFPLSLFFSNTHTQAFFFKFLCIFFQLITLGAAVEYFNHTTKHTIVTETHLHGNLLISIDSLLLCSFFINGFNVGYKSLICSHSEGKVAKDFDEREQFTPKLHDKVEKHIPLKNSAQTLTPDMDVLRNLHQVPTWNGGQATPEQSAEEKSLPSVIQHRLESMNVHKATTKNLGKVSRTSRIPQLKSVMTSPKLRRPFVFKFSSPKGLGIKSSSKTKRSEGTQLPQDSSNRGASNRYMSRLSTIPDLSRSMLNFSSSSQGCNSPRRGDKSTDSVLESAQWRIRSRRTSSIPAIELERSAVERINSALLPPCLKVTESFQQSPNPSLLNVPMRNLAPATPEDSVQDSIERNDLEDIPQIPQTLDESLNNFFAEHNKPTMDIPQNVTMEDWEKGKDMFLKRAASLQKGAGLLPAFQFDNEQVNASAVKPELHSKTNFSFPLQKPQEPQPKFEDNNYDTISALEEYFRDIGQHAEEESENMQNGFQHHNNSSSFNTKRLSRELKRTSTKHSPTKSIISMISGRESLGHHRSQTVLANANTTDGIVNNSPSKSSPSRSQRLKRMGKKLSLSNISDTMISMGANMDGSNELPFHNGHPRGKSFDFSYIHTLQSSHSPTKSASGLSSNHGSVRKDRRHSVATERGLATITSPFGQPKNNAAISECKTPPIRSMSGKVSEFSTESVTDYPDIVMSEYDRERWNTMLSLKMIDSRGQLKIAPTVGVAE
ncbi:IRC8 (YJL051W) [Zygosaccharomyces parabailii]|nr:IRC8 (YJL051W) [Zygosaccharomyces parabailii]